MGLFCNQPPSVGDMSKGRRWLVFLIGMLETMMWSGNIFGWASLVHVLKLQGVFSDLCRKSYETNGTLPFDTQPSIQNTSLVGCSAQDERFALVYTVACVLYSTPGILVGYSLHHMGLAFTRVLACLMISSAYLLLAFTSVETPNYLWGSACLLAIGGNTIRMAGLQLGNLFPERRNTAMAIISGIFTPSAGLFMLIQSLYESNIGWENVCYGIAIAALTILLFTPFMPRHHVPYVVGADQSQEGSTKEGQTEDLAGRFPLTKSVFSISNVLHLYWIFINLFSVVVFAVFFNSWINKFSETQEEAGRYSRLFGYANLLCFFVTPLPGLLVDTLAARFKQGKSGVEAHVSGLQATIVPMVIVSASVIMQLSSLFFYSPTAVYIGLLGLIINRPSCLAVGNPFVRARFPVDHFNRIIGIHGTIVAFLTLLQYPHFLWAQTQYNLALVTAVVLVLLSLSNPLHLLSKSYLRRVLRPLPQKTLLLP